MEFFVGISIKVSFYFVNAYSVKQFMICFIAHNDSQFLPFWLKNWKITWCSIFIDDNAPSTLVLPNQWMWDIIDEFIYQFQSFCQYRAKIMNKPEEEMTSLKENVYKVLT